MEEENMMWEEGKDKEGVEGKRGKKKKGGRGRERNRVTQEERESYRKRKIRERQ